MNQTMIGAESNGSRKLVVKVSLTIPEGPASGTKVACRNSAAAITPLSTRLTPAGTRPS
jgi:hypothetical protein